MEMSLSLLEIFIIVDLLWITLSKKHVHFDIGILKRIDSDKEGAMIEFTTQSL